MSTEKEATYTIQLQTKPYVRRFMALNFGEPADLSKNPRINNMFRRCLKKPVVRYDKNKQAHLSERLYSERIEILISESDFYRYGWELSKSDSISFNREMEELAKFFMRTSIAMYENLMQQREAILLFQERFGFPEDIWSYEAIKKDYYRNASPYRVKILPDIVKKIEEFLMVKLSDLGTYSQLNPKSNENNCQEH